MEYAVARIFFKLKWKELKEPIKIASLAIAFIGGLITLAYLLSLVPERILETIAYCLMALLSLMIGAGILLTIVLGSMGGVAWIKENYKRAQKISGRIQRNLSMRGTH